MAAVTSFAILQPRATMFTASGRPWLLLPGPHQSMALIRRLPGLNRTSTWSLHDMATCRSLPPSNADPLPEEPPTEDTPAFVTGVNWYCYSALGLLFLTDFTPLGAAVQSSESPGAALALLQWGAFVLPTLYFSWQQRYDLRRTFGLNPCQLQWLVAAAAAGPALHLAVTTLVQLRLGGLDQAAAMSASSMGSSPGWPAGPTSLAALLPTYILSPAVAEELLFRGFLLTALRKRLGRVDAVAVNGALFALMHLSIQQFFNYSLLGFACSFAAVAADSVLPAIVLHASYNLAALLGAGSLGS